LKKKYEKPAIIYQDVLTTRACSPHGATNDDALGDVFDPAELFKK